MRVFNVRNAHQALPTVLEQIALVGYKAESRNGTVRFFDGPVTTTYRLPTERVMFWPDRDANPFFHLMEGLWMLAGRNDLAFVTKFVKRMASFSDDGRTLHGAYGFRWRHHFGYNQVVNAIQRLRADPTDRRVVISMWDGLIDTAKAEDGGRDVPCNTHIYVCMNQVTGHLDITVCCRSNDIVWGAYGANAVHFSMLHEFIASAVGVPVGRYHQVSNNLHVYDDVWQQVRSLGDEAPDPFNKNKPWCPYRDGLVSPYPMVSTPWEQWMQDLEMLMSEGPIVGLRDPFFRRVVTPIWMAHRNFKENQGIDRYDTTLEILEQCKATDWKMACVDWVVRRRKRYLEGLANES